MESWKTKIITQRSIILALMILMTSSFGMSEGFFLKNFPSEATTEESKISTQLTPDTFINDSDLTTHDEIDKNVSEKLTESPTHIVNSVKNIVSLVLDEHTTNKKTQLNLQEEDNQIDIDLRNLSVNGDNDIPAPEALNGKNDIPTPDVHLTDFEHDTNEPTLSIVKIPEANGEDIATALEDNIRNSVKDEIQLEQNFESSAIDVIEDIPDLEVRQTLTEDLRAIEYPQSIKKLDDPSVESNPSTVNETSAIDVIEGVPNPEVRQTLNEDLRAIEYLQGVKELEDSSVESNSSVTNEKDKISSTETHTQYMSVTPKDNVTEEELNADSVETTVTTVIEAKAVSNIETLIENIPDLEVRQIHSADQSIKKLDDPGVESNYTQDISVTPTENVPVKELMADLAETTPTTVIESKTVSNIEMTTSANEILQEITLIPSEEIIHNLDDMQDTSSNLETNPLLTRHIRDFSEESNTNEVLTDSQDSSKNTKSSNSKSLDSSEPSNSSDSVTNEFSISSSIKDENVASEETSEEGDKVISEDASIEENVETENVITAQSVPLKKVSPTPRPKIAITTTAKPTDTVNADPILVEEITESTGDILNDVSSTIGESKHVVIKKPGVDEEIATEIPILHHVDDGLRESSIESVIVTEPELEAKAKTIVAVNHVLKSEVAEPPPDKMNNTHALITENNLLETEDPHVHAENQNDTQYGNLDEISLENTSKTLTKIHDNNSEGVSVAGREDTLTEHKSVNTSTPEIYQPLSTNEHEDTDSQTLTIQTSTTLSAEQSLVVETNQQSNSSLLLRTLNTDEPKQVDSLEKTVDTSTLDADQVSVEPRQVDSLEKTVDTNTLDADQVSVSQTELPTEKHVSSETPSTELFPAEDEKDLETSTEIPSSVLNTIEAIEDVTAFSNEISKNLDESPLMETPSKDLEDVPHQDNYKTSTEKPTARSNGEASSPALVTTLIEAAELTTEFARTVDSFRSTRDETAAISDEVISPTAAGRSFNAIIAEGLGKPLPTRSVGDEPSTSSYSSEDKTTTVVVLCSSAAVIFIAFSIAIYLITFQRQHGTLDIEMQEQRCGKDDLEDEEDAETRVTLLNQFPQMDSDEHNSD